MGGPGWVIGLQFSACMERSEEDSERQSQREREEGRAERLTLSVTQFISRTVVSVNVSPCSRCTLVAWKVQQRETLHSSVETSDREAVFLSKLAAIGQQ